MKLKVLDLFSGIGGFSLGLERAGMKTIAFCEIEEFPRKVLKKHWPDIPCFKDVRELHAEDLPERPNIIVGGYPCQPFSLAGKRRGPGDDRHLWPEIKRIIQELDATGEKPSWCVFENVVGHVSLGLDQVLSDLEGEGYSCWPLIIPACAMGTRHIRERVWILANSNQERLPELKRQGQELERTGLDRCTLPDNWNKWNPYTAFICRGDDGIPGRVDRIKGLGNSVVPQIVQIIGRAIMEVEKNPPPRLTTDF